MKEKLKLTEMFNTTPEMIYRAWLNSEMHSNMTGGDAECLDKVDGDFSTWNGYITGSNIELKPNEKIVQNWRTSEFSDSDEDSRLEVYLKTVGDQTEITIVHTNIPEGQTQYEQGWINHYLTPMKDYFK